MSLGSPSTNHGTQFSLLTDNIEESARQLSREMKQNVRVEILENEIEIINRRNANIVKSWKMTWIMDYYWVVYKKKNPVWDYL